MKKKLFALLLVLCLLLTACSAAPVQESAEPTAAPEETAAEETQPEETTAPEEDSVFIVGTTAEILTANRSEYNFDVISGTLSQLAPVWLDENGDYQPLLCDYATEDSKTWTLTVREGMTGTMGSPSPRRTSPSRSPSSTRRKAADMPTVTKTSKWRTNARST